MSIWIRSTASILPQTGSVDFEQWIDSRQLRRMSRIMKFGVASALMALRSAGVDKPDAIIGGTGLGCLADTGSFLKQLVTENEGVLNPTPFMQSTHNTITSTVALMLQCTGYNSTYTQNSFSFEHALLDALLQIEHKANQNILVGGFDEMTEDVSVIMSRLNVNSNGEGAAWTVLSGERNESNVQLLDVQTYFSSKPKAVAEKNVDLILCGTDIDEAKKLLPGVAIGTFKRICGEHPSASAFAFSIAENIFRTGVVPKGVLQEGEITNPKKILIYNKHCGEHYSVILLSKYE